MIVKPKYSQALIIHNHNLIMNLNQMFAELPEAKITKDDFMEMQLMQWKAVMKFLGIKIRQTKQR